MTCESEFCVENTKKHWILYFGVDGVKPEGTHETTTAWEGLPDVGWKLQGTQWNLNLNECKVF
jgi:hypothetical protein